jgi:MarR family transcriptional regulator, lower aerobic nicotinate degradation pathway regulator
MTVTKAEIRATEALRRFPEELLASPVFLLKKLGFRAKERGLEAYERIGLNPYHHAILITVEAGPPETQGAIAETLGYDKGQLVGLLDELEERSLIERRRDPEDRRRHLVQMTEEGNRTLRRLRGLARELEDEFLEPLSEAERAKLHALLFKLAAKHEPRCALFNPS